MDYMTFMRATRDMKPSARSDFFNSLSESDQTALMDNYYGQASPELFLIQTRINVAAEKIEEAQDEGKDTKELVKLYNALCDEHERLRFDRMTQR